MSLVCFAHMLFAAVTCILAFIVAITMMDISDVSVHIGF
jgi:hypothetical protein